MSAIFLSSVDTPRILPSKRLRTYGPNTMPVANIPSNPGSLHFWQIHPIDIPRSKISEILNNIKILLKTQKKLTASALIIAEVISFNKRFKYLILWENFIPIYFWMIPQFTINYKSTCPSQHIHHNIFSIITAIPCSFSFSTPVSVKPHFLQKFLLCIFPFI